MQQCPEIKTVIIDDELSAILLLEEMLSKIEGVKICGHGKDIKTGVRKILKHRPDIVFLDVRLKDEKGFDLIKILKDNGLDPAIAIVTAYDHYGVEALKAGSFDYILKPVDPDELMTVISRYRQKQSQFRQ